VVKLSESKTLWQLAAQILLASYRSVGDQERFAFCIEVSRTVKSN